MSRPFEREEPSAEMRKAARALRDIYVSLMQEGFSTSEAVRIIGAVIAAQNPKPDEP